MYKSRTRKKYSQHILFFKISKPLPNSSHPHSTWPHQSTTPLLQSNHSLFPSILLFTSTNQSIHKSQPSPIKFQKENHHVTLNLHIPPSILFSHNNFPIQASTHCKSFVHCVSDKSTPLHFCLFTIHYSTRQYLTVAISATISQSTSITH